MPPGKSAVRKGTVFRSDRTADDPGKVSPTCGNVPKTLNLE
jgi:hypothetical protein